MGEIGIKVNGRLLAQARRDRALGQQQVATAAHIVVDYYGNIERGKKRPTLDTLANIVKAINELASQSGFDAELLKPEMFLAEVPPITTVKTANAKKPQSDLTFLPFRRNPFFSGRQPILAAVREYFCSARQPILALSGLGGIGKTQLAIEYAHKYSRSYTHILWASAESEGKLRQDLTNIAFRLENLTFDRSREQNGLHALCKWLSEVPGWLLILDNTDTPSIVDLLLPNSLAGNLLVTSRAQVFDCLGIVERVDVRGFSESESLDFLSSRLRLASMNDTELEFAKELHVELDGLPLALEQAAAFMVETKLSSIQSFVAEFRSKRLKLFEGHSPHVGKYPSTIATTWLMNFNQVKQVSQASVELLQYTAFLADSAPIAFSFLIDGVNHLPDALKREIEQSEIKELAVSKVLSPLARFSLVHVDAEKQTYSVHPLVQEVVRDLGEF